MALLKRMAGTEASFIPALFMRNMQRVVLRGAKYDYYEVKEYPNGKIVLEPRVLSNPQLKKTDGESVVE